MIFFCVEGVLCGGGSGQVRSLISLKIFHNFAVLISSNGGVNVEKVEGFQYRLQKFFFGYIRSLPIIVINITDNN